MKLSSLFRDRNRAHGQVSSSSSTGGAGDGGTFCPPKRDRSKSLCVPQAMPLIRVETCKEDASVPSSVHDLLLVRNKRRTSMAV